MRFAYLTDLHIKGVNPEHRLDNYPEAICLKLESFGWGIAQNGIQFVLIGGDVFDIPKVSNKLLGNVSRIMRNWRVPIYVLPGNHDIYGHNLSTLEHTSLGLLANAGVIHLLIRGQSPYVFNIMSDPDCPAVSITAMEYIDDGSKCSDIYDPRDYQVDRMKGDINIIAAHAMIMPNPSPHFQCIDIAGIETNADMILCGHFHQRFEYTNQNGTLFLNPGPSGRTDSSSYNIDPNNKPGFYLIEITRSSGIRFIFMPYTAAVSGDQVFDLKAIQAGKAHQVTLNTLKAQLKANIQPGSNIVTDIYTILDDVIKQRGKDSGFKSDALKYIQNAEHSAANNSAIAKGYIPAHKPVNIKRMTIVNFQSHENTEIDFDEAGFNAIVGETDMGKSSIIRAIRWCLYNEPNGTEMIRIGENRCEVAIEFSNGNIVTRARDIKSAGIYSVYDAQTQKKSDFKSFGRNIPIEVMNAHQIPKGANIADQLEGPFMLSSTAPERAAMIGSIVGTDIVDAAIGEASGEIAASQKMNIQYEKAVMKLKDSLKAYDDLDSQIAHEAAINAILNAIVTLEKKYDDIYQINDSYSKTDYERGQAEYYLSYFKDLDQVQILIDELDALHLESKEVSALADKYDTAIKKEADLLNALSALDYVPGTTRLIDALDKAAIEYTDLLSLYNQQNSLTNEIYRLEKEQANYAGLGLIDIAGLESLYYQAAEINGLLDQYKQADTAVSNARRALASCKDPAKVAAQYQDFLVQLGKCPTCGFVIDKASARHIEL